MAFFQSRTSALSQAQDKKGNFVVFGQLEPETRKGELWKYDKTAPFTQLPLSMFPYLVSWNLKSFSGTARSLLTTHMAAER